MTIAEDSWCKCSHHKIKHIGGEHECDEEGCSCKYFKVAPKEAQSDIPLGVAVEDIEGLLFFEGGVWVATFTDGVSNDKHRSQVNFCCWCGVPLKNGSDAHKH